VKDLFSSRYYEHNSIIHTLNPTLKLLNIIFFIIILVSIQHYTCFEFLLFTTIAILITNLAKIPFEKILKEIIIFVPFLFFILLFALFKEGDSFFKYGLINITYTGIHTFFSLFIKSILSITMMLILIMTTPFIQILRSLKDLHVPDEIILIFFFLYRYSILFIKEINRLLNAMKIRSVDLSSLDLLKNFGSVIGVVFIRTFERAERIYQAMLSRGFDTNKFIAAYRSNSVKWHEIYITTGFISIIIILKVILSIYV